MKIFEFQKVIVCGFARCCAESFYFLSVHTKWKIKIVVWNLVAPIYDQRFCEKEVESNLILDKAYDGKRNQNNMSRFLINLYDHGTESVWTCQLFKVSIN